MKLRFESPHNEVADAKRRFLQASVPMNPMRIVKEHPLSSTGAAAAVGVVVGALSGTSFVKLVTAGWVPRLAMMGMQLLQQHGLSALRAANPPEATNAMG